MFESHGSVCKMGVEWGGVAGCCSVLALYQCPPSVAALKKDKGPSLVKMFPVLKKKKKKTH